MFTVFFLGHASRASVESLFQRNPSLKSLFTASSTSHGVMYESEGMKCVHKWERIGLKLAGAATRSGRSSRKVGCSSNLVSGCGRAAMTATNDDSETAAAGVSETICTQQKTTKHTHPLTKNRQRERENEGKRERGNKGSAAAAGGGLRRRRGGRLRRRFATVTDGGLVVIVGGCGKRVERKVRIEKEK